MSAATAGVTAVKANAEKSETGVSPTVAEKAADWSAMMSIRTDGTKGTAGSALQPGVIKNAEQKTVLAAIDLPLVYIEIHESEIPWLKIFVRRSVREFSDCTPEEKQSIWIALDIVEREMLRYFRPEKINVASFGNMLPQVHWHIMARFKEDSCFPEPMWGKKQREASLELPPMGPFLQTIAEKLGSAG